MPRAQQAPRGLVEPTAHDPALGLAANMVNASVWTLKAAEVVIGQVEPGIEAQGVPARTAALAVAKFATRAAVASMQEAHEALKKVGGAEPSSSSAEEPLYTLRSGG